MGSAISEERRKISKLLKDKEILRDKRLIKDEELLNYYDAEWLALKILENNEYIKAKVFGKDNAQEVKTLLEKSAEAIIEAEGCEPEVSIIDKRYAYVAQLMETCVRRESDGRDTLTERIDKIATGKWTGIPIFILVMFLLYQITMSFGNDFLGSYLQTLFDIIGDWAAVKLTSTPALWQSFITDAVIGGLGSVLVFVPLMFTMFFIISFLEDSGYMARAAYVMDRFMHNVLGLHGKTAVSMIISSGCNVAGIMSTRTLENKKDRMIAILINPFISCSARLPVYALFAGAFFQGKIGILPVSGLVVFSLYLLGIVVAIIAGKVLSKTIFKQEESYFIMELPPYRIPTLKSLLIHMWEKTEAFIQKAGTVLFGIIILIWALSVLPLGVDRGV
jgi:ferrous iron transport protein B